MRSKLPLLSLLLVACSGSSVGVDLLQPAERPDDPTTFISQAPDASEKQGVVAADAGLTLEAASDSQAAVDAEASADASQPEPDASVIARYGVAFNGTVGSRLSVPVPATLIGQTSVTLEAYYRIDAHTGPRGLVFSSPNAYCAVPTDGPKVGQPHCCAHDPNASACVESAVKLNTGTWHHFAFVLANGAWSMFLDGVKQGSVVSPYAAYPNFPTLIVYEHPGNHLMFGVQLTNELSGTGVLDEFRLTHSALYTTNFTPPKHLDALGVINLLLDDGSGSQSGGAKLTGSSWASVDR